MPVVVNDVVTAWYQKAPHIGRRVLLRGRDNPTEDHPLAKIASAGERPAPMQPEAPIDSLDRACGRQGRGNLRARIIVPDVLLRLRRKQAKLPVVDTDDGKAPGTRATDSADLHARLEEYPRIQLIAPITPGLDRPKEHSLLE